MQIESEQIRLMKILQQDEINGYYTYSRLAKSEKNKEKSGILSRFAEGENLHYARWKRYTQIDLEPNKLQNFFYFWISRIFGLTFGIRLMESDEIKIQGIYENLKNALPEVTQEINEEKKTENDLLNILDEEALLYAGSVVLGLNDALVELTGSLAGLTFAFQNTKLIALAGLITGISATLSMSASEYFSRKSEGSKQDPVRSAIYTGLAYIITVFLLIIPFLILKNYLFSLGLTIFTAILIIALFNFYISVARRFDFKRRFFEMAGISISVAFLSFVLGLFIRKWLGISI
jgi:VIT1/CCC1 family predicted Fe2+/Mn2+ transporter